jgi:2,3-bisphosphoglycerate-independent phosphoglycerate mutase
MIGNSGVHSFNEHLYALLLFARNHNIENVFLHLITDGRDSPPKNAIEQIKNVQEKINEIGIGKISTIIGRYFAMDRDQRLDRTKKAFDCLTGTPEGSEQDPITYLEKSYVENILDEFIEPMVVGDESIDSRVRASDAVVFFNFRTDRPRQLTEMFLKSGIPNLRFVTMTKYRKDFQNPVMFATTTLDNTLGEVVSQNNLNQLRAAETEKIGMVTYYFSGQREEPFAGESHLFVDSPKIATYDLEPRMSTDKLVDDFSRLFRDRNFALGVINIACPDMVAHTGKIDKTIEAIKAADEGLAKLVALAKDTDSYLLVTADHGNAEGLLNIENGEVDTEHSALPVPLVLYHDSDRHFTLQPGKLGDIAPTILNILELPQPTDMNGKNLIFREN